MKDITITLSNEDAATILNALHAILTEDEIALRDEAPAHGRIVRFLSARKLIDEITNRVEIAVSEECANLSK